MTNDLQVPQPRRDVLTQEELRRNNELTRLMAEQYDDEASTRYADSSMEDTFDEDLDVPVLLDINTAWERENERYRKAGRRRSST